MDEAWWSPTITLPGEPQARALVIEKNLPYSLMVNKAGESAVTTGRLVYDKVDQGLVDAAVNGSGRLSDATGEELRHINSGRVQNYAALMFAGAAILAGAFVIFLAL